MLSPGHEEPMMEMNHLMAREQVSLMRARSAGCASVRSVHDELARSSGHILKASCYGHRNSPARVA